MKYEIKNDRILIYGFEDFNPTHILECGQIFRYKKTENRYEVFSLDKRAEIKKTDVGYEILTDDPTYFENFFDLQTDYSSIKNELLNSEIMAKAIEFGYGIRILKQDQFEMLISFIISANNNIKRIQKIVDNLCVEFGKNMDSYYAFPTFKELKKASLEDLLKLGLGFRAKYIISTLRLISEEKLIEAKNLSTEKLLEFLQSLSGVGPKVADCVALFGFGKFDCFPVDTWINKVYNSYFSSEPVFDRKLIRKKLVEKFKNLSGFAQQYLFYYKRELDKGNL